ncbi:MAG: phosphatidylserine decarboxylase [Planctomycetota bacterium]|jgi:phosphatidylserine decarboxylase
MRIPLTPHGVRELILFGGGALLGGALLFLVHPALAVPFVALAAFVFSFFRDPERKPPGGPDAAVAPADGTVTDIEEVDEPHFLGGKALRIGIFLSVFNVHVNRAPLEGKVKKVRYSPGRFLDARDPRCKSENESNLVGFEGARGPFAIRQVAGLIARRIVFPLKEGDPVARGQRMGMIKFGSRTELLVPAGARVKVETAVGRKVKGGETVILSYLT